jgi:hypothetical protein
MKVPLPVRSALIFLVVGCLPSSQGQTVSAPNPDAAARMESKLQHIVSNGRLAQPDTSPTEFTDQEINSYFAEGKVKLPAGVQSVNFQAQPGVATATAQVDFDQIKRGRNSANPLLSIFSGVHTAVVVAHAHGEGGQGFVHVDSVVLDGTEIPPILLQLFVQKFVQPKYPNAGIDSHFALPDRVDAATVGLQKLLLTQK